MLARRIIPCLDVKDGRVVKGVRFRGHVDAGDPVELASRYAAAGADEIVLYDITASAHDRTLDFAWVRELARTLDVPFCVAGGIRTLGQAMSCLESGADKVSVNSPALERPELISEIAREAGAQCVVVGVDSLEAEGDYVVCQYTGDPDRSRACGRRTRDWVQEAESRGAGEIVLNCMDRDGVRRGYDIKQLSRVREGLSIPLIASGGAGEAGHFAQVFKEAGVSGALAASVFHKGVVEIPALKRELRAQGVEVRP